MLSSSASSADSRPPNVINLSSFMVSSSILFSVFFAINLFSFTVLIHLPVLLFFMLYLLICNAPKKKKFKTTI